MAWNCYLGSDGQCEWGDRSSCKFNPVSRIVNIPDELEGGGTISSAVKELPTSAGGEFSTTIGAAELSSWPRTCSTRGKSHRWSSADCSEWQSRRSRLRWFLGFLDKKGRKKLKNNNIFCVNLLNLILIY